MGRWKGSAQTAVMLTFDLDAETLWLSGDWNNLSKPGLLSQGTYGARVAAPLILDLLRRRGITATFFVPAWTAEQYPDTVKAIVDDGHELGHHGYIHEHPTNLSLDEEEMVLERGITSLRHISGRAPTGYRSPAWEFSEHTIALLEKHGFRYSSNLMSHILPYRHEDSSIIELPVQWIIDDAPFFYYKVGGQRPISSAENAYTVWSEEFAGIHQLGGLFNLTMHPQLIGRPGRLMMLERMIDLIESTGDVWFATGEEVTDWWSENSSEGFPDVLGGAR